MINITMFFAFNFSLNLLKFLIRRYLLKCSETYSCWVLELLEKYAIFKLKTIAVFATWNFNNLSIF